MPGLRCHSSHGFFANVPTGYVVSAATGTNWEDVGVRPNVTVPATEALAKAWSLAAARLKETAHDPQTRACLEALSLAQLDGSPSLPKAELAGHYNLPGGHVAVLGPIVSRLAIFERDGRLYEQDQLGGHAKPVALRWIGGDRYQPTGVAAGCSFTFFKQHGKIALLEMAPMASLILEK